MKRILLTFLSVFSLTLFVNAQTTFLDKVTIDADTGNNPYTIASGFIDGDSNVDILVGTDVDHELIRYIGNGDGTFTKLGGITNTLINITGLKLVDLNSDGDLDILAAGFGDYDFNNYGVGSKVVWFENDGSGNFGTEQLIYDALNGMSGLFVGTIDSGSTADIAITSYAGSQVFWFSNNGSGGFTGPNSIDTTLSFPGSVNMKDIDNDGDLDALVSTGAAAGADVVEIFRNDLVPGGSVAWTKDATSVSTGKNYIFNATFEDLDGDANLDILFTELNTTPGSGNFYWVEEDGAGGYTETAFTTAVENPSVAQVKDLDDDGLDDIILSNGNSGAGVDVVWFKNNGGGVYAAEQIIDDTQSQVFVYAVVDFDNDLDLDIATCSFNQDQLNYFENEKYTLSISSFNDQKISFYPNPTKNVLNFTSNTLDTFKVSVFDILGKKVIEKNIKNSNSLDVSKLAAGLYVLNINTISYKFIKE